MPRRKLERPRPESRPSESLLVIANRLHSASIHLLRRVRKQDIATGEGPARLSALSVLVFGGPKTLGELAEAEQVKPPTISRIAAGLVRSRLATIAQDPTDARRKRIFPTASGSRMLHQAKRLRVASLASQLDRLSAKELALLDQGVEILLHVLENWV